MNPGPQVSEQPEQVRPCDCLPSGGVRGQSPAPVRYARRSQAPSSSRSCPCRHKNCPFPVVDNLGSTVDRERVKAFAWLQAVKGCYLVGSTSEPAELVEAAEHAVRRLSSVAANPHLLPSHLPVGTKVLGQRTRRCDRNQLATFQSPLATEDDLSCRRVVTHIHLCEPDQGCPRVWTDAVDRAHDRLADLGDHHSECSRCDHFCIDLVSKKWFLRV